MARIWELRVLDISMELKMDSYIFIHHRGQFTSTDTKTKIAANVGKALFIDVWHDVRTFPDTKVTLPVAKWLSAILQFIP